jgi:hypothetical protein
MYSLDQGPHEPDLAIAQRHGWISKTLKYKVSFRVFVTNYALSDYVPLGRLISTVKAQRAVSEYLDDGVYKAKEQLLNLVHCRKTHEDQRVLLPLDPERPLHHFFASHLEGAEFPLNLGAAEAASQDGVYKTPPDDVKDGKDVKDVKDDDQWPQELQEEFAELMCDIVAGLNPARARDRNSWLWTVWAIVNSGRTRGLPDTVYHEIARRFSERGGGDKYDPDATRREVDRAKPQGTLGLASLLRWLDQDDPPMAASIKDRLRCLEDRFGPTRFGADTDKALPPVVLQALANMGFAVPALRISQLGDPAARTWTFTAPGPQDVVCPCCTDRHTGDVRWLVVQQPQMLSEDACANAPVWTLRCDKNRKPRIIAPLKSMLEDCLRRSQLPRILGLRNPSPTDSNNGDEQRKSLHIVQFVDTPQPSLLVLDEDSDQHVTLSLPQLDVTYPDGRTTGLYDIIGAPALPRMVVRGGAVADGWTGRPVSQHELVVENPRNEPPARLLCDWENPPFGQLERATMRFSGQARRVVMEDATNLSKIRDVVTQALVQHISNHLDIDVCAARMMININVYNNCTTNNYNNNNNYNTLANTADEDSLLRSTKDLADLLLLHHAFVNCVEVSSNEFCTFNVTTGLWSSKDTRDHASAVTTDVVKQWRDDGSDLFSPKEFRHLLSATNMQTVLRQLAGKLKDAKILAKLDECVPLGALPFDDGMFQDGQLRPYVREDFVSITVGHNFVPRDQLRPDDVAFVERFYDTVFPCPQEREVFLKLVGFALFGNASNKHFLVLSDMRSGYNGKSTLMKFVSATFGDLARKDRQILVCERQEDPNAHQTGMLAFRAKRLCWVEEPSQNAQLDIAKLKDLTGGKSTFEGRAVHSAANVKFAWRAFVVVTCNEDAFPIMEAAGDPAFVKRIVAINMRSKFVEPGDPELSLPHTFVTDRTVEDRLFTPGCVAANVHLLCDAYQRYAAAPTGVWPLPPACQAFIDRILLEADPLLPLARDFVDTRCTRAPGSFSKKTAVELGFQDCLNEDSCTAVYNKPGQRRNRNKVLKAVLLQKGVRFQTEHRTPDNGRYTDVFMDVVVIPDEGTAMG